jgi:hypothetical protein
MRLLLVEDDLNLGPMLADVVDNLMTLAGLESSDVEVDAESIDAHGLTRTLCGER